MAFNSSMPMFWGDYLRDTGHLSPAEHGAYLMLIAHQWTTAKPLPDDDAKLSRIAKMTMREWRSAKAVVEPFFDVGKGEWNHKRVERDLIKAKDAYNKRSNAGSIGGATTQARRQHSSSNATSPDQAKPNPKPKSNSIPRESFDSLKGNGVLVLPIETIEKAREIAPGWDVYALETMWKSSTLSRGIVLENPPAAFLGFVKKHVQENRL